MPSTKNLKQTISKIIKESVNHAFLEDKQEIPRSVNFKGKWIKPDEKHIEDQIRLAACIFDSSEDEIISQLRSAKPVVLSNKIWQKLDNTLSWHVSTPEKAQEVADEYGYHYNDAMFGYMNDREVVLPVIVYSKGAPPTVLSGETELLFASAFKIQPKVIVIILSNAEEA